MLCVLLWFRSATQPRNSPQMVKRSSMKQAALDAPAAVGGRRNALLCGHVDDPRKSLPVAVFVFAWRRVASLKRLVASLQGAEYCGANLSLTILFDARPAGFAVAFARTLSWPHGPYRYVIATRPYGIRGMWTEVLSQELEREAESTHVLPLEDDIEVSPLFYVWLLRASWAYGPFDHALGSRHSHHLAGISLFAPRLNEIRYPMASWSPRQDGVVGDAPVFLFQMPCSWGALFFREHWRRFRSFYNERARPPFYNASHEAMQRGARGTREVLGDPVLAIRGSRASTWPRSWKRFMIDYFYGRGDVMLYPSSPADPRRPQQAMSLSTTYMERGDHSGTDSRVEGTQADALKLPKDYDLRKTVPLLRMRDAAVAHWAMQQLPPLTELPVIDLFHKRVPSLHDLEVSGHAFVEGRAAAAARRSQRRRMAQQPDALAVESASDGEDDRPATCDRDLQSPVPSAAEYSKLSRLWLCDLSTPREECS